MVKKNKKHQELSKEDVFQFLIGYPAYPESEDDYKHALKIYKCCVIKKDQSYCYECSKFPCSKYDKIKDSMNEKGFKPIKYQKSQKDR